MDTLPPRNFFDIYHRLALWIDLKGCETARDVEIRVWRAYNIIEKGANNAKKKSTRIKWFSIMKIIRSIMKKDTKPTTELTRQRKLDLGLPNKRTSFADAIMKEADEHQNGIVANSMKHGYPKAMKMEQKRKQPIILSIHTHKKPKSRRKSRR
jgi:hypothetical protein